MRKKGSLLRELPILVVVALVVSLFIKTFAVQFFYIPSGSMENTLQIKDRVAVNKVPVGVLPNPTKQYLVKRVVGVAGDHIVCCTKGGNLTINDVEVTEPYIYAGNKPSEMKFDVTVPEGKIWVMGDHRGASADSRYHQEDINKGFVPLSRVTGRVVAVIWPFKNITYVPKVDVLKK